jgi:hypothetical protein
MTMMNNVNTIKPSGFRNLAGIEYFLFEEDFIEQNVRCIPMIVRFKMDAAGIKLKLAEWSKFKQEERIELAIKKCSTDEEVATYKEYLAQLVITRAAHPATVMEIDMSPEWSRVNEIPVSLQEKAGEFGWEIGVAQWASLTDLQRFALLKLKRPGHENENFPIAMKEFGLAS